MSNILEKDTIGEHEGWLNNPMFSFFVGIFLLSLFSILGSRFHDVSLASQKDNMIRDQRFDKMKAWRLSNAQDLTVLTQIPDPINKGDVIYQIPIEDARKLLKEDFKREPK